MTWYLPHIRFWFHHFNSHAHVERDIWERWRGLRVPLEISTHTLTWSVTNCASNMLNPLLISTHTLTWSVTEEIFAEYCKERFQLTRSRGAWRSAAVVNFQPCQFQLTRSRGAWRSYLHRPLHEGNFNSHAHVERDVLFGTYLQTKIRFQLTRSRGAWPAYSVIEPTLQKFQLTRSRGAWPLIEESDDNV